ncbi:MAG: substrate-binding periplasmic protein [Fervidobacterium sp.]
MKSKIFFLCMLIFILVSSPYAAILYTYPQDVMPKYMKVGSDVIGFCNDLISELNKELRKDDIQIVYKSNNLYTVKEIFNALEKNEIQIFVGAGYSQEREKSAKYIPLPLYGLREMFITKKGFSDKLLSLPVVKVGVIEGTLTSQRLPKLFGRTNVVNFKNLPEALSALDKNQIDTIFYSSLSLGYVINHNPEKYEAVKSLTEKYYHYIVLSNKVDKSLSTKIEQAIKNLYLKNTIRKILERYNIQGYVLAGNVVEVLSIDWKPYEWFDPKDNKWKGIDVDTVKAVFSNLGFEVSYINLPWERCLEAMKVGAYDGIMSLRITKEREEYLIYPKEPLSTGVDVLWKMKNKNIDLSALYKIPKDAICAYTVGYAYRDWFWNGPFRKEPVPDDVTGFRLLKDGRIDLFVCNLLVGKELTKELGIQKDVVYSKNFNGKMIYYLAFSKNYHGAYLAEIFSSELKKFKKTNEYKSILKFYGIDYNDLW